MSKPFQSTKLPKGRNWVNAQTSENDQSISNFQTIQNHQTAKRTKPV